MIFPRISVLHKFKNRICTVYINSKTATAEKNPLKNKTAPSRFCSGRNFSNVCRLFGHLFYAAFVFGLVDPFGFERFLHRASEIVHREIKE